MSELERLTERINNLKGQETEILNRLNLGEEIAEYQARRNPQYQTDIDRLDEIRGELGRLRDELISKVLSGVLEASQNTLQASNKIFESSTRIEGLSFALIILTVVLGIFAVFSGSLQLISFHYPFWENLALESVPIVLILIFAWLVRKIWKKFAD